VFRPPPTQRDLETAYRRLKWFYGLVSQGVLGEPAAEGPPAAFLSKQLVALLAARRQLGILPQVVGNEVGDGDEESGVSGDELLR